MEAIANILGCVSIVLLLLGFLGWLLEEDEWVIADGISGPEFVRAGVRWSLAQFKVPKNYGGFRVVVHRNRKNFTNLLGYFNISDNRAIGIYLHHPGHRKGDHGVDPEKLSNTIIEETVHSLQILNNSDSIRYSKILGEVGYDKHPQEIEAKKYAAKYEKDLVRHYKAIGYLRKK